MSAFTSESRESQATSTSRSIGGLSLYNPLPTSRSSSRRVGRSCAHLPQDLWEEPESCGSRTSCTSGSFFCFPGSGSTCCFLSLSQPMEPSGGKALRCRGPSKWNLQMQTAGGSQAKGSDFPPREPASCRSVPSGSEVSGIPALSVPLPKPERASKGRRTRDSKELGGKLPNWSSKSQG